MKKILKKILIFNILTLSFSYPINAMQPEKQNLNSIKENITTINNNSILKLIEDKEKFILKLKNIAKQFQEVKYNFETILNSNRIDNEIAKDNINFCSNIIDFLTNINAEKINEPNYLYDISIKYENILNNHKGPNPDDKIGTEIYNKLIEEAKELKEKAKELKEEEAKKLKEEEEAKKLKMVKKFVVKKYTNSKKVENFELLNIIKNNNSKQNKLKKLFKRNKI